MGSGLIEVHGIRHEKPGKVLLMENEEVIQAFSPYAPQKTCAHSICSWRLVGRPKHLNATCSRHACKIRSEFAIIIPDQIFGVCPYGVASRSCCATQGSVGERVTFTWMTFRDCSSMIKKAK